MAAALKELVEAGYLKMTTQGRGVEYCKADPNDKFWVLAKVQAKTLKANFPIAEDIK